MKTPKMKNAAVATAATVAVGLLAAPLAAADEDVAAPTTTTIGQQGKLVDGNVVQSWTITGLKPSSDVIPYTPRGTLWEATATDEAIQGSVQPIVSNLNARTADGQNYRVLFGVATAQGVNPGTLAQGEKTTGKVYFDVTGATPDTVVYNAGGRDLLVWRPAPPAPVSTGGQSAPSRGSAQSTPAQSGPAATAGTPAAGTSGTPAATGSSGTPAAATEGTPAATGSSGTPATEGTPAAATEGTQATSGSAGTPAGAAAEGTPAATDQAATGSQGTPALVEEGQVAGEPHGPGTTHSVS